MGKILYFSTGMYAVATGSFAEASGRCVFQKIHLECRNQCGCRDVLHEVVWEIEEVGIRNCEMVRACRRMTGLATVSDVTGRREG